MPPIDIRDTNSVEVGNVYLVPTLFVSTWKLDVPVLEPAHEDVDVIQFGEIHWHIDWRFTTQAFLEHKNEQQRKSQSNVPAAERFTGIVVCPANPKTATDGAIALKPLLCRRETPPFPITWFTQSLESHYAHTRLRNLICPHRGISLHNQPVKNGRVICPGHGLTWDVDSGELIRSDPILCMIARRGSRRCNS